MRRSSRHPKILGAAARVLLVMVMACALHGCATSTALKLEYYAKNIIITSDNRLLIDEARTYVARLTDDLFARGFSDATAITVHAHEDSATELFDLVLEAMKAAGYRNVTYKTYTD